MTYTRYISENLKTLDSSIYSAIKTDAYNTRFLTEKLGNMLQGADEYLRQIEVNKQSLNLNINLRKTALIAGFVLGAGLVLGGIALVGSHILIPALAAFVIMVGASIALLSFGPYLIGQEEREKAHQQLDVYQQEAEKLKRLEDTPSHQSLATLSEDNEEKFDGLKKIYDQNGYNNILHARMIADQEGYYKKKRII